jgi:predicted TIM-barrel fold metal-dependent hydrolase
MRVFDCHVHVQPWEQLKPAALAVMTSSARSDLDRIERARKSPGELLRLMDEQGVERAALINYAAPEVMGFTDSVNAWVCDFVRSHEDRLVAVGSVHPALARDPGAEASRLFDLGIRMLKVHPPHQLFAANAYRGPEDPLARIYSAAQDAGRPVMIHTGTSVFPGARNRYSDPMAADDVAVDFPKLKLILAHAGRPLYMTTAVFLARRHPNVHLDLSGIPPRKLLEYLPRLEDLAPKCLWGTDYPSPGVLSMAANVKEFASLPIAAAARERILWDNAAALIK